MFKGDWFSVISSHNTGLDASKYNLISQDSSIKKYPLAELVLECKWEG